MSSPSDVQLRSLYLDLLKKALVRSISTFAYYPSVSPKGTFRYYLFALVRELLARRGLVLMRRVSADNPIPAEAETMIGFDRLTNIQRCLEDVLARGVPGDLIETGVWRGGACIFMRGVLKAYGDTTRSVWVADSFQGFPKPDADRYPADAGDQHWTAVAALAIPLETVQANFRKYGLLDAQVRFLSGWFRDTLPAAPITRLALLRLDGGMYGDTIVALESLYPKVSSGGYILVDNYWLEGCARAVREYRDRHGITAPVWSVDSSATYETVCWQKP